MKVAAVSLSSQAAVMVPSSALVRVETDDTSLTAGEATDESDDVETRGPAGSSGVYFIHVEV